MSFEELTELVALLRSPQGCPWDREQTHQSIRRNVLEEAYEVVDAIDSGDMVHLKEELGDLLLQVVFQAQIASENNEFGIDPVISGIVGKLKLRHPHIFGDVSVNSSAEVIENWEHIKSQEKDRSSALSGVPSSMAALSLAQKLQQKAARVGFDWECTDDLLDKLPEEISEFMAEDVAGSAAEEEFGDILFTLVNLARRLGLDAELCLRRTANKFRRRFENMEQLAGARGIDFSALSLEEKDALWDEVKKREPK